jgi:hypothetical protein
MCGIRYIIIEDRLPGVRCLWISFPFYKTFTSCTFLHPVYKVFFITSYTNKNIFYWGKMWLKAHITINSFRHEKVYFSCIVYLFLLLSDAIYFFYFHFLFICHKIYLITISSLCSQFVYSSSLAKVFLAHCNNMSRLYHLFSGAFSICSID